MHAMPPRLVPSGTLADHSNASYISLTFRVAGPLLADAPGIPNVPHRPRRREHFGGAKNGSTSLGDAVQALLTEALASRTRRREPPGRP